MFTVFLATVSDVRPLPRPCGDGLWCLHTHSCVASARPLSYRIRSHSSTMNNLESVQMFILLINTVIVTTHRPMDTPRITEHTEYTEESTRYCSQWQPYVACVCFVNMEI